MDGDFVYTRPVDGNRVVSCGCPRPLAYFCFFSWWICGGCGRVPLPLMVMDQKNSSAEVSIAAWNGPNPVNQCPKSCSMPERMNGAKNCARYMAMDSSGITVEAAVFPALMDAEEMMNGIPTPLANPMHQDPPSAPNQFGQRARSAYPMKNRTAAVNLLAFFKCLRMPA